MAVVKRLVRTDAAGYYIEYTHDDGHVETQPSGRPLTKEDIQRKVRQQLSSANSVLTIQAEKTRAGFIANDPSASNSRARDVFNQVAGAQATAEFSRAVGSASKIAQTASVRPFEATALIKDITLGGPAANEITEYADIQPTSNSAPVALYAAVPIVPISSVRGISDV